MNKEITLYTKDYCPYCVRAKALLTAKGAQFKNIEISNSEKLQREMVAKSGRRTVPQIFIGDRHIGGADDLFALERLGQLDALLQPFITVAA